MDLRDLVKESRWISRIGGSARRKGSMLLRALDLLGRFSRGTACPSHTLCLNKLSLGLKDAARGGQQS